MTEIEKPLISVIVPVYNVENYMRQCVDSLLNQTLTNIEIILVDDGATDTSPKICDEYARRYPRVKVIHKLNGGLGSARNVGMKEARGKYIGFVDSDDYVSVKMYETLLDLAEANKADCAYCGFTRFWNDTVDVTKQAEKTVNVYSGKEIMDSYLLDRIGCVPTEKYDCTYGASVWGALFKNETIQRSNVEFVSEREFIAEDMIFDIDFIPCCKKIAHTTEILYFYRFNPNSLTTRYVADRFEKNVALCNEMGRRLNRVYNSDTYKIRLNRYFLKITRIALIEEVIHIKENGRKIARENISRIAHNQELVQILNIYPVKNLPIPQKIFFTALKQRRYILVNLFIKINLLLRKWQMGLRRRLGWLN